MCKASQPLASANYKLDLVYGKSSPVISQLQCHIVIFAPLTQLKKKKREREMPNLCQDWTSLVNQVLFQEERIKGNMLTL